MTGHSATSTQAVTPPRPHQPQPELAGWPLRAALPLGALPTAPGCGRAWSRQILREWGLDRLADNTELLVSELTTNAVQASAPIADATIGLWLASDSERAVILVWDPREAAPRTAEFCGFRLTELPAGSSSDQRRVLRVVSMRRSVLDAPRPAVVTAADMVAGHVTLDISCLDRIYLNGYVAKLQTSGGVVYFFNDHRGKRIVSPALFEPIGAKFRKDMGDWAQANGVPVIRFKAEERKADVVAPYLEAAAAAGRSQVAVIGCAQEFQRVWTARKHDTGPGRSPQFSFTKEQRRVSVFYIYIWDARMGPGFIKICTYFPYPVKAWVNGHEWAKRQALAAGISFTELSNGFASCDDPAALQQICNRFGPGTVQVWFERWMARLPLPLTYADRDAGFWWELSMRQVETSRTLVFSTDVRARAFFEALLCENMDLGRPERAELLFRRGQRAGSPAARPATGSRPGSTSTAAWSP